MLKTALIVDDSQLARLTLRRLLVNYDIAVSEVGGVIDAEHWISHNQLPDIIFMDVTMPELDGFEGLARLKANQETCKIPVIMYSGDISKETRSKARYQGATGYLPKPADASRLDYLLNALNNRLQTQERTDHRVERPRPSRELVQESVGIVSAALPGGSRAAKLTPDITAYANVSPVSGYEDQLAELEQGAAQLKTPDTGELIQRIDKLERQLETYQLNSKNTEHNFALVRQRQHVTHLQRQLAKSDRWINWLFLMTGLVTVLSLAGLFMQFF